MYRNQIIYVYIFVNSGTQIHTLSNIFFEIYRLSQIQLE